MGARPAAEVLSVGNWGEGSNRVPSLEGLLAVGKADQVGSWSRLDQTGRS